MKGRSCKILVEEIAEAIDKVERYTHGLTFEVFKDNDMAIDAVLRNLEVIGEASKGIPLGACPRIQRQPIPGRNY